MNSCVSGDILKIKRFRVYVVSKLIEILEYLFFARKVDKKLRNINLDLVIDVGANLGQTINIIKRVNPKCKVIAFEPNKELYHALVGKFDDDPTIKLENLGVSSNSGELAFHENVFHATSTFEDINFDSSYVKKKAAILGCSPQEMFPRTYNVPVVSLYEYFENNNISHVDLIKIDVEGHEFECLVGLFKSENQIAKRIQIENHKNDMYLKGRDFSEYTSLLSSYGYEYEFEIKHSFGDFSDIFFLRK